MIPHVIAGYHEDLDNLFSKNIDEVIRIVEEHKTKPDQTAVDAD